MRNRAMAILLMLLTSAAAGATLHVPGDYPSIQAAINAAVDGDTVLVNHGFWPGPINFLGKAIVVLSDDGPAATTIYTNWDYSVVYFENGEDTTSVIEGFTLRNNVFASDGPGQLGEPRADGGGVHCVGSSPMIVGNIIRDCYASAGGGIWCWQSDAVIVGNTIQNNDDGGINFASGSPAIIGNQIIGNDAYQGGGLGIYSVSDAQILGNVITGNTSDGSGGGIYFSHGSGTIANNLIDGNESENGGSGGGLFYASEVQILNNVVSGNVSQISGGGFGIQRCLTTFTNNTLAENVVEGLGFTGGGLVVYEDTMTVECCILWGNQADVGPQIAAREASLGGAVVTVEYCDIQYGQDSIYVEPGCTLVWGPGNIDEDPLFETGPLSDYHLSLGSPCIDAGNPDPEYNDPEDPLNPGYALWPALGVLRNDMGAYGGGGVGYWVGIEDEAEPPTPAPEITLRAFPNPFRASATLVFELAQPGPSDLRVYDLSGRLVEVLFSGDMVSGPMSCCLDGSQLPSGIYLARLQARDRSATVRLVKL